ncbi:MAG: tetratricopeptide repeat protein [Thermosulfidibacteraceae bacterium]
MRRIIALIILITFTCSLFSQAFAQPESLFLNLLLLNLKLLNNEKPTQEEVEKLIEALKKKGNAEAYITSIELLNNLNLMEKALEVAKDGISKFQNNDIIYIYYGELLTKLNNTEEGTYWIKKALSINPSNKYAYTDLIQIYLRNGKIDEAFKLLNEAEQKFPNDPFILFLKGKAYYLVELYRNAEIYLEKSTEIDPNNIEALRLLAEVYVLNNKLDKASKLYEELIKSGILSKELVVKLIKVYIATEQYQKALQLAEKVYSAHPDEELKELLALIYIKVERIEKAKEMLKDESGVTPLLIALMCKENKFEKMKQSLKTYLKDMDSFREILFLFHDIKNKKCIEISVIEGLKKFYNSPKLYYYVSQLYLTNDNYEKSEIYAKNAIALDEKNGDYWFLLGSINERKGKFKKSSRYLEKALELKGNDPVILNYYGYMLIATEIDVGKGIELVKKALDIEPENTSYLDSLAWGYFKIGELRKALEIQEKVYKKENENAVIVFHLAEIYYKLGDREKAMELYKRTKELIPKTKDMSPWEKREIESRLSSLGF